jgi:hypothetical protein
VKTERERYKRGQEQKPIRESKIGVRVEVTYSKAAAARVTLAPKQIPQTAIFVTSTKG